MKIIDALSLLLLSCFASGKVTVMNFKMCEDKDYPIKFTTKLKTENDMQVVEEGTLKTTVDMGDNVKILADVYSLENGKYDHFIAVKETICNVLEKYLGDFGFELQKSAGLEPGTCPVPKGEYSVKNHPLDFEKFKFKNVPKGQLKVVANLLDVQTNDTLGCLESEIKLE